MLGKKQPHLMCFAVSWPLQAYLKSVGIDTELIEGSCGDAEHYWLRLQDGRILDATADQFNNAGPKVYLGEQPDYYKLNRRAR